MLVFFSMFIWLCFGFFCVFGVFRFFCSFFLIFISVICTFYVLYVCLCSARQHPPAMYLYIQDTALHSQNFRLRVRSSCLIHRRSGWRHGSLPELTEVRRRYVRIRVCECCTRIRTRTPVVFRGSGHPGHVGMGISNLQKVRERVWMSYIRHKRSGTGDRQANTLGMACTREHNIYRLFVCLFAFVFVFCDLICLKYCMILLKIWFLSGAWNLCSVLSLYIFVFHFCVLAFIEFSSYVQLPGTSELPIVLHFKRMGLLWGVHPSLSPEVVKVAVHALLWNTFVCFAREWLCLFSWYTGDEVQTQATRRENGVCDFIRVGSRHRTELGNMHIRGFVVVSLSILYYLEILKCDSRRWGSCCTFFDCERSKMLTQISTVNVHEKLIHLWNDTWYTIRTIIIGGTWSKDSRKPLWAISFPVHILRD